MALKRRQYQTDNDLYQANENKRIHDYGFILIMDQ